MDHFYITTTIPYVNALPHLGHALEFVQADAMARWLRFCGNNVFFLSGTDENAMKNVQSAEAKGMPIKEFVDKNSGVFKKLLKELNISNDQFIRTIEERHKRGAQALWLSTDKKYIYKKKYRGMYCLGCELFYKQEELKENKCPLHPNRKVEEVEEENYFFKLSEFQGWLSRLISNNELKIIPESKKNEALSMIKMGLEDFSISRSKKRTRGWGVPVPGDKEQTIYVWYDALSNYINALGYPDKKAKLFEDFWLKGKSKIHVLGKDVSRFHSIYWPAMLKAANLPIPDFEFIHGFITLGESKMSKSSGDSIDPFELINEFGVDTLRYFLLREIPAYGDGDFSFKKLKTRYSGDLANGLGNFSARVLALGEKIGVLENSGIEKKVKEEINKTKKELENKMKEWKFHEALATIWKLISFGDGYIEENKIWAISEEVQKKEKLYNLVSILDNIVAMIGPFLPGTAEKIKRGISWRGDELRLKKIEMLFPRL